MINGNPVTRANRSQTWATPLLLHTRFNTCLHTCPEEQQQTPVCSLQRMTHPARALDLDPANPTRFNQRKEKRDGEGEGEGEGVRVRGFVTGDICI